MLLNLAFITILSFSVGYYLKKIKLPPLLGMLIIGVLLGPFSKKLLLENVNYSFIINFITNYDFIFINDKILNISSELRSFALIIILIRAGLGINRKALNKVGFKAIKMSFIPGMFEAGAIFFISYKCLNFPIYEAGAFAFIIAAVSPAVIVPQMLGLKEKGIGKEKEIPTLILTGSSIDDVFAITMFGVFLSFANGQNVSLINSLISIPLSIVFGVIVGLFSGKLYLWYLEKRVMRNTKKAILFMVVSILLYSIEEYFTIPFASLIAIMSFGFIVLEKDEYIAKAVGNKFNKIWIYAEMILFVLIGSAIDISQIGSYWIYGLGIILIGIIFRSFGVLVSLIKTNLNSKEKIFCIIAYIPKATVQAAIGAIPLSYGFTKGYDILSFAVLSILITAPLGAIGIELFSDKLIDSKN